MWKARRGIVALEWVESKLYLFDQRIEDPHLRPVVLHLGDKAVVRWVVLVRIVGRAVGEDDVQGDVEVAVVDIADESRVTLATAKVDDAWLNGQVLLARRDQGIDRGRG